MKRALRHLDELLSTLLHMSDHDRREFIAVSSERMRRVFRGERDSIID